MTNVITKNELAIEDKFTASLKNICGNVLQRIIFFGSRVKGTVRPDSDFDFLIVLKTKDASVIDKIYDEVVEFFLKYSIDISLKIYSGADYERFMEIPTPFFKEIKRTGRVLWTVV